MDRKDFKYTADHEWVRLEGDIAFVGITDHAQLQLGDIVYVDVETLDNEMSQAEVFGTIEAVKTVSDLFCPISGTIIEFNDKLKSSADLINKDPYGDGWIIKIRPSNIKEWESLMDWKTYEKTL